MTDWRLEADQRGLASQIRLIISCHRGIEVLLETNFLIRPWLNAPLTWYNQSYLGYQTPLVCLQPPIRHFAQCYLGLISCDLSCLGLGSIEVAAWAERFFDCNVKRFLNKNRHPSANRQKVVSVACVPLLIWITVLHMFPFMYKGLWRFEQWADYYDVPCPNNLHNWLITIWVSENTRFGDKGVKMMHIDWEKVAIAYKRHLYVEPKREAKRMYGRCIWCVEEIDCLFQTKTNSVKGKDLCQYRCGKS